MNINSLIYLSYHNITWHKLSVIITIPVITGLVLFLFLPLRNKSYDLKKQFLNIYYGI